MHSVAKSRSGGFTLVELVVVVLILGILAAVAVPKVWNESRNAQLSATVQSLRAVQDAADMYFAQNRAWPPDAAPGRCPAPLRPHLRNDIFNQEPPVGGLYDWSLDWPLSPFRATMSIVWFDDFSRDDCAKIDSQFDDGNGSTGEIRYFGVDGGIGQLFFESESW